MNLIKQGVSRERVVFIFAGVMSLLAVCLTFFVHAYFIWFSVFIGVNLIVFGTTGFCPANIAFKALGVKSEVELLSNHGNAD